MKKAIIGVLSLLAMVACSQSEVVDVNRNNDVIEFGVVANSLTRAETVYSNTNMPESFIVWATFDGKIFIDGDVIKRQGSSDYGIHPGDRICNSKEIFRTWCNSSNAWFTSRNSR